MHIFIIADAASVAENLKKHVASWGEVKVLDDTLEGSFFANDNSLEEIQQGVVILNTIKIEDLQWLEKLHTYFFKFPAIALVSKDQISHLTKSYIYPLVIPIKLNDLFSLIQELNERPHIITIGPFAFYSNTKVLKNRLTGQSTILTEKEAGVLEYLYINHPRPVGKEELLREIWGYAPHLETHTLETHLYRLRKKLEAIDHENLLLTLDQGYLLKL